MQAAASPRGRCKLDLTTARFGACACGFLKQDHQAPSMAWSLANRSAIAYMRVPTQLVTGGAGEHGKAPAPNSSLTSSAAGPSEVRLLLLCIALAGGPAFIATRALPPLRLGPCCGPLSRLNPRSPGCRLQVLAGAAAYAENRRVPL